MFEEKKIIEYVVMNPSGNITILVTSDVEDESEYLFVAKKLLAMEPTAEQVGFLQYDDKSDIVLNMAGNEFCGNATMSAAVYYGILHGLKDGKVVVHSSGANDLVNVNIKKNNEWDGIVEMPRPLEISEVDFGNDEKYTVVFFKGIAHVIVDIKAISSNKDCENKILYDNISIDNCNNKVFISDRIKKEFESKIKLWCEFLEVPAIGIMLCDNIDNVKKIQNIDVPEVHLIPLVYVNSIDTLYWESSCASGTTAVSEYLKRKLKKDINVNVRQAGGMILGVESDGDNKLLLKGKVKLLYKKSVII